MATTACPAPTQTSPKYWEPASSLLGDSGDAWVDVAWPLGQCLAYGIGSGLYQDDDYNVALYFVQGGANTASGDTWSGIYVDDWYMTYLEIG